MLTPTVIPPGFVPVERHSVNAGGEWFADITVYRDPSGASVAFGSGSPGGIAGVGTGQHVVIRGHEAEIFHESTLNEFAVIWIERTPDKPCHQYSISASGLDVAEFVEILDGVR